MRSARRSSSWRPTRRRCRCSTGCNIAALSFTAGELADAVARRVPGFGGSVAPDFRQAIVDSWPMTIDDSAARQDWGWQPQFDLDALVTTMLRGVGLTPPPGQRPHG